LSIRDYDIDGNEIIGVLIRDGARAHFKDGTIEGTQSIISEGQDIYGHNLVALEGGMFEMHQFIIKHAASCGILLDKAYIKISDGEVRSNHIGVRISDVPEESYDPIGCVSDDVMFADNLTRLDVLVLPVPGLSSSSEPYCPGVSW
jgi:hypothetical protein